MSIFRVKSVKIYTGQKKFTRTASVTNIRYVQRLQHWHWHWRSIPEDEGKYLKKENIFFLEEKKTRGKGGKYLEKISQGYWEVSVSVSVSRLLPIFGGFRYQFWRIWSRKKSLGFGFGEFGLGKKVSVSVSENLVSEKSLGFGFGKFGIRKKVSVSEKIGLGKKVSVSVSENLVSEKKYRFRFRKIWYWKKSLGIGFGKIWYRKKVSVLVSENLVSEKSLGIGFGQNFGIVIQWCW